MKNILQFEIQGKKTSQALVMIHGWPDDQSLWEKEFERFSNTHCCVRITLPNCGEKLDRRRGADFPELVELISRTIKQALPDHQKIIIAGHDWGAYLAYLFERTYPERIAKMVTMDVGGHFKPGSPGHALMFVGYQWWLVAAWLIGPLLPFLGDWMTRALSKYARAPRGADVYYRMNYFYFYLWRALFFPKRYRSSLVGRYRPGCPILYFYGENKLFHFHSTKWEKIVAESRGSEVVAVPGAGHWLMLDNHEFVASKMEQWLEPETGSRAADA